MNKFFTLSLIALITSAPRIPMLPLGFGRDPDAYRNISVAQRLASDQGYTPSRFPGYPVHEYLLYLTGAFRNPITANLLSLVPFVLTVLIIFQTLSKIEKKTALPYTLIFAFMPVSVTPSVEAMDYALSLFLFMSSMTLMMLGRPYGSAVSLAAATASRITYGAGVVVFFPFFWSSYRKALAATLLKYVSIFVMFWLAFFSPVLLRYGPSFFTFYDNGQSLGPLRIFHRGMSGMWGNVGAIAALALLIYAFYKVYKNRTYKNNATVQFGIGLIVVYWLAFSLLPHEAEYLLPVAIGMLIVFCYTIKNKIVIWGFLFISAVQSIVEINVEGIVPGPLIAYKERSEFSKLVQCVADRLKGLPDDSIIVVPTSMERAFLRQAMFNDRPDLTILLDRQFNPDQEEIERAFEFGSSILPKTGPRCAVDIRSMNEKS